MIDTYDEIQTTSHSQTDLLAAIIRLHNGGKPFEVDCTYSIGQFYADGKVPQPKYKFDIKTQSEGTQFARAEALPFADKSIHSIIFDPPFLDGNTPGAKGNGRMHKRFTSVVKMSDLWQWYNVCLGEFYRVLAKGGIVVVKCQDVVSQRVNFFSHCYVLNSANAHGFYAKDLFILLAKNRIRGKWKKQSHARKYHSYFWVLSKQKIKVVNHLQNL